MTTQELISVHLGDGATPDEEALLSRALVSDPAVCREFVAAARMEGALHAHALSPDDRAELGATLEAAGIACSSKPSSSASVVAARTTALAAATCLLLAAGAWALWSRRPGRPGIGTSETPDRRPPPVVASPTNTPDSSSSAPLRSRRDALAARAAEYYLPKLECANQPLDRVLEYVLGEVAAANHLERAEWIGFELAWQPLDVASASSPPRVTLRQSQVPLAATLEWLAILTDCTVQWHEQGARLVESLPEPENGRPTLRTLDLAALPVRLTPSDSEDPSSAAVPTAAEMLESIGLTGPHLQSARLDSSSTLTVDLTEAEWKRLQKVVALRVKAAPPPLSIASHLVELATPQEIATQVVDAARYRHIAAALEEDAGAKMLATPTIHARPGQPFQIEMVRDIPSYEGAPDWAGLRVTGHTSLSGEVIRISASVRLRLPGPAAGGAGPSLDSLRDPTPAASLPREYAADLEALIPPGHTVLFAITEADDDRCLALHLSAGPAASDSRTDSPPAAGQ